MAYYARNQEGYTDKEVSLTLGEVDQYLDLRQNRLSEEDRVETLLIGSSYVPIMTSSRHKLNDIDLYINNSKTFESLLNLPNTNQSRTSEDVIHMNPNNDWVRDLNIEFFRSLERPLEFDKNVDEILDYELEQPYKTVYSGNMLDVFAPSPESYATTKQADDEKTASKYVEQLLKIDEALETSLSDNHTEYSRLRL